MVEYLDKTGLAYLWSKLKAIFTRLEQATSVASLVFLVEFDETTGKVILSRPEGDSRLQSATIDYTTGKLKITIKTN